MRLFFQNIKLNDGIYLESAMNNTGGQVDDPDLVLNSSKIIRQLQQPHE
jgi:hypothetical protein